MNASNQTAVAPGSPIHVPELEACLRREAEEPAFTTPSIARWAPAALRSAPPRVHLALPARPPQVLRLVSLPAPFLARGLLDPIWSSRGSTERASQAAIAEPAQRAGEAERSTLRALLSAWGARTGVGRSLHADPAPLSVPLTTGRLACLGTMRLSAVATSAPLLVAALQVLFLLEAAHSQDLTNATKEPSKNVTSVTVLQQNLTSPTVHPASSSLSPNSSSKTTGSTPKATEPSRVTHSSTSGTNSSLKPPATTKSVPQSAATHSVPKSPTAASNSSVATTAALATATANINAKMSKGSKFDIGSFVGGIVLTLGVLSILYIGCKTYYSRGIRYRTIDEHDAII
ncbi:porimin [Gracilinanus agilis]|uniref:porimin n=1 Tax=Gracilinanus agilis TaxID=191870 RepID=UPI001CFE834C|nr:porimin [Gracilinanus agilis]